jgi:uncharacterized glyoxalase superfamily protein PhnB
MKIQSLTPMLRTWDLRASIAFYTEVLGFECESLSEECGWASLRRDGVSIMLAGPNQHEGDTAPAFTGSLYFHTDDVADLWQRLKDKDRTCYLIANFQYGMSGVRNL